MIRAILFAAGIVSVLVGLAAESPDGAAKAKAAVRRAYVQSGPDGVFYARSVQPRNGGFAGPHTDVYRVEGERDEDKLVDRYDWFARGGLVLGWSPIKGEVAVMAAMEGAAVDADWRGQEELRFSTGGRRVKSYTSGDLIALGAEEVVSTDPRRRHAGFRMGGCEQVPSTNEYDFVVEVAQGKRLRFDITTGELRPAADRGRARAAADIEAGNAKVLYYGKPWSGGKPLVDDASGLPVEVVSGCAVTAEFVEETDAYNAAARTWARDHPATRPVR